MNATYNIAKSAIRPLVGQRSDSASVDKNEPLADAAPHPSKPYTPHDALLSGLYRPTSPDTPKDVPPGLAPGDGNPSMIDTSLYTDSLLPGCTNNVHDPAISQRPGPGDELWSQLSQILELQSEIAGMHVDLEGVGLRAGQKNGATMQDHSPNKRRGTKETHQPRPMTEDDDDGEDEDEDNAAVDPDDDSNGSGGKRAREEEFAKLSERFTERKHAIDAIMGKLDDLSLALNSFHALPTPTINLSSRSNTASSEISVLPSPPLARREHNIVDPLPALSLSTNLAPAGNVSHFSSERRESLIGADVTPKLVDSPLSMHTEH